MSIGSVKQASNGPKRGQKKMWDKNPPKDKGTPIEKKSQDVAKIWSFKCKELGHFVKDYEEVNQDWVAKGGLLQRQVWSSWVPIHGKN